jgi:hypothetical protein
VTPGSAESSPSVFLLKAVVAILTEIAGQDLSVAACPPASRFSCSRQHSF